MATNLQEHAPPGRGRAPRAAAARLSASAEAGIAWLRGVDPGRLGWALFAAATAIGGALIIAWGLGQSFFTNEWIWFTGFRGFSPTVLLHPESGSLVLTQRFSFSLLLKVFGGGSQLPFQVLAVVLQLLSAGLLYVLARRRLGPLLALVPAVLLIFFGAGWDAKISSVTNAGHFCVVGGLGALVALDRRDLRGDLGACALLGFALASSVLGLIFAAGIALELVLSRAGTWMRRLWVVAVPVALWLVWYAWAQKFPHEPTTNYALGSLASGVFDQLAAAWGGISGLFRTTGEPDLATALSVRSDWGRLLAAAFVVALVWRATRRPRPDPRFWTVLVLLAAYLLLVASHLNSYRTPDAPRWVYFAGLAVLLMLVEMGAGLVISRRWKYVIVAALGFALIGNIAQLHLAGSFVRSEGEYNRAELAALELARGRVAPGFVPEIPTGTILPNYDMVFPASSYFAAIDDVGSPAYSPSELASAPAGPRQAADVVSLRAYDVRVGPLRGHPLPRGSGRLGLISAKGARTAPAGRCLRILPRPDSRADVKVRLPRGGFSYRAAPATRVQVALARYGDVYAPLPPRSGSGLVRIPVDRAPRPWRAELVASSPVRACPV